MSLLKKEDLIGAVITDIGFCYQDDNEFDDIIVTLKDGRQARLAAPCLDIIHVHVIK